MVTTHKPQKIGANDYLIEWTSDLENPTFYIFRDGVLINTTSAQSMTFHVEDGESLILEIFDEEPARATQAWPPRMNLTWKAVANTAHYSLQRYVDGDWVELAQRPEDGHSEYVYVTPPLEDSTVHQFRVLPVGINGNDGTPLEFQFLMVRHPDTPSQDFEYDDENLKLIYTE